MFQYILHVARAAARINPSLPMVPAKAAVLWTAIMRWAANPTDQNVLHGAVKDTASSRVEGWWLEAIPLWESALDQEPFQEWLVGSGRQYAQDGGGRLLQAAQSVFSQAAEKLLYDTINHVTDSPTTEEAEKLVWVLNATADQRRDAAIAEIQECARAHGVLDPREDTDACAALAAQLSIWPSARSLAKDILGKKFDMRPSAIGLPNPDTLQGQGRWNIGTWVSPDNTGYTIEYRNTSTYSAEEQVLTLCFSLPEKLEQITVSVRDRDGCFIHIEDFIEKRVRDMLTTRT